MTILTSSAKQKGRKFQQHIRDLLLKKFSWLGEGDVISCSMGSSGVDILMSPLARKTFPVSIEAKKMKRVPTTADSDQSKANAYEATLSGVAWCPHGLGLSRSRIIFDLNDFINWYEVIAKDHLKILKEQEESKK